MSSGSQSARPVTRDGKSSRTATESLTIVALLVVHVPTTNVAMAGTAVTGVCLNQADPQIAEATAKATETGNTQGDVVARGRISAAGNSLKIKVPVILRQDQMIGVDFVSVGGTCSVTIFGFFA